MADGLVGVDDAFVSRGVDGGYGLAVAACKPEPRQSAAARALAGALGMHRLRRPCFGAAAGQQEVGVALAQIAGLPKRLAPGLLGLHAQNGANGRPGFRIRPASRRGTCAIPHRSLRRSDSQRDA